MPATAARNSGSSAASAHQLEVRALRVRVRDDERGVDLAAIREHDAGRAAAFDAHRGDIRGGPQLDARAAAGFGHGRRDRAHSAHHVPDEALLRLRAAAQQVEQQTEQRARVVGPAVLAVEAVRENQRLEVRRGERAVEKFSEAAGGESDQVRNLAPAHAAKLQREPEQLAESAEALPVQVGRRLHEERLEVTREARQPTLHLQEALAVGGRELLEQSAHARVIAPPGEHRAVGRDGLHRRFGRDHAQAVAVEREVADDLGPQHARHVGRGGDAAARRLDAVDLLGDRATAEQRAALEHKYLEAGAREVERGREPVVAAADDDDVVSPRLHRADLPFVK